MVNRPERALIRQIEIRAWSAARRGVQSASLYDMEAQSQDDTLNAQHSPLCVILSGGAIVTNER